MRGCRRSVVEVAFDREAGGFELVREIGAGGNWRSVAAGQFGGRGSFGNTAAMRAPVLGAWFAEDLGRVADEARRSAEVTSRQLARSREPLSIELPTQP